MGGLIGAGLIGMICGNFAVTGLDSAAGGVFNWVMTVVYNVITANWENLAPPAALAIVNNVNSALKAIGVSLVSVLTLANTAKTTTSIVEMKRSSVLLRVALKLIVAEAAVLYSYDIFMLLYDLFADFAKMALAAAGYDPSTGFVVSGSSWGITVNAMGELLALLLALFVFVATVITCFSILLTVLGRFFKIFIYAMIAPVPLALLACDGTDRMGKRYLESFFCVCMEGLLIAAACALFAACFNNGGFLVQFGAAEKLAEAFSWLGDSAQGVASQIILLLNISIFSGMVKGSDRVVRELIG